MSGESEQIQVEKNEEKVEIDMAKILHYSTNKVPENANKHAGMLILKRNMKLMKKWTEERNYFQDIGLG